MFLVILFDSEDRVRLELVNDDGFMRASSCECGERSDAISDQEESGGGRDALDDKAAGA